jgi:arylsulfatase A-like enzyme
VSNSLNRREFLKLASLLPLGFFVPPLVQGIRPSAGSAEIERNIIIIIFDALSAYDISFYGYARQTTPNLARLAERGIVYHNHFAGGNFTIPGTASLLTGVLPWSHRAINLGGDVEASYLEKSIFHAFADRYRIAYTHNGFANQLLSQFSNGLDEFIPRESLYLDTYDKLIASLFKNDEDIATVSWIRNMQVHDDGSAYSLFLSHLYEKLQGRSLEKLKPRFPRGIPAAGMVNHFLLETAMDSIGRRLVDIPQPFIGYFHFLPPHHPYRTSKDFYNAFRGDGVKYIEKPNEILARRIKRDQATTRREYDEYILYCDQEFGRLYNSLETSGLLENSWLILTSDHGEMFERGIDGHGSDVLYQPVVRIPLILFEPGRQAGMDIFEPTSAIDVLPTLMHLLGKKVADWAEGRVLPPFSNPDSSRSVFAVQAIDNPPREPLTQASIIQVKENYKLHYYFGYPKLPEGETVKLFDIKADPEEMADLSSSRKGIAAELLDEVKAKLQQVNRPYST